MTLAIRILIVIAVLYLLVATLAWKYQERLAWPGPRDRLPDPERFRIAGGKTIEVLTADSVMLRGWYLPPDPAPAPGTRSPALLWFCGNMETIAAMGAIIRDYRVPGTALVVLEYRGYGESEGVPSEAGVYRDADAAWDFLATHPDVDSTRIAVYGRSIGSVPALYLGTSRSVRALVLDSPFTSARAMAARHYPWLPPFIVRMSLDNLARARELRAPLLVFHGSNDAIAPIDMGRAVAAAGRGELVELSGAGHNDTYNVDDEFYRAPAIAFLRRHLDGEEGSGKKEE